MGDHESLQRPSPARGSHPRQAGRQRPAHHRLGLHQRWPASRLVVIETEGHGGKNLSAAVSRAYADMLAVVDDGTTSIDDWLVLTSLVGELVVSKEGYGDVISLTRRKGDVYLAPVEATSRQVVYEAERVILA